ncbi:hypothetical protein CLOACE_12230 [Clostridium acetireducens DSM 10703]|uniref:Uncharacterized protein n=1 Tax=Clostridium acetireducens DSM 10703 TaxID=1121290 RepID=A0A1E8EYU3_9CLOT|nr:hypothetical protein [Clostridium acetireducens]OFI06190.1 hypothetical protein CLOACE_12230 [Clostridium acetireducens DSM 10703]
MLVNTYISFALKDENNKYNILNTSLFELNNINNYFTSVKVMKKSNQIIFKVKCSLCNEYHNYKYNVNDIINEKVIIGGCDRLGSILFFIGNKYKIIKKVNRYNSIHSKIYAMI